MFVFEFFFLFTFLFVLQISSFFSYFIYFYFFSNFFCIYALLIDHTKATRRRQVKSYQINTSRKKKMIRYRKKKQSLCPSKYTMSNPFFKGQEKIARFLLWMWKRVINYFNFNAIAIAVIQDRM